MSGEVIRADFLVLGSGIAGLRAALGLASSGKVLVVTKDQPTESNTGYAQGGVAVALGEEAWSDSRGNNGASSRVAPSWKACTTGHLCQQRF